MNAFVKGNRLVLGEGRTADELQASGRWLATADAVEVIP